MFGEGIVLNIKDMYNSNLKINKGLFSENILKLPINIQNKEIKYLSLNALKKELCNCSLNDPWACNEAFRLWKYCGMLFGPEE